MKAMTTGNVARTLLRCAHLVRCPVQIVWGRQDQVPRVSSLLAYSYSYLLLVI